MAEQTLTPPQAAALGAAYRFHRPKLRRRLRRYWQARVDWARVSDAAEHTESEAYSLLARWLAAGKITPQQLAGLGLWIRAALERAPSYFAEQLPVADPLQQLGADLRAAARSESGTRPDDPLEIVATLLRAYRSARGDCPPWVAQTLALQLTPLPSHRDRAAAAGVPLETYRSRLRVVRRAIVGRR